MDSYVGSCALEQAGQPHMSTNLNGMSSHANQLEWHHCKGGASVLEQKSAGEQVKASGRH